MVLRKSFYIRWSAGRSPRVHEVNPGRDPSTTHKNQELDFIYIQLPLSILSSFTSQREREALLFCKHFQVSRRTFLERERERSASVL